MTLSASEVVLPAATASTAGTLEPKDGASQTVQLDASATSTAMPTSGTTTSNQSSEDPTFTEKVKHFFNNLFTW